MNFSKLKEYGRDTLTFSDFYKDSAELSRVDAARESEILALAALEKEEKRKFNLSELYLRSSEDAGPNILKRYEEFLQRRAKAEPIAYILGQKEFYGREFYVDKSVLVPRPETELLLELAVKQVLDAGLGKQLGEHLDKHLDKQVSNKLLSQLNPPLSIYEVGVGSGCLIISLALELEEKGINLDNISFFANDISKDALSVARFNAKKFNLEKRILFEEGDLLSNSSIENTSGPKLIISNPPYVSKDDSLPRDVFDHEPHLALFSDGLGSQHILKLTQQVKEKFSAGENKLLFEIAHNHAELLPRKLEEINLQPKQMEFHLDYSGVKRFLEISF